MVPLHTHTSKGKKNVGKSLAKAANSLYNGGLNREKKKYNTLVAFISIQRFIFYKESECFTLYTSAILNSFFFSHEERGQQG
jgi:hypothetical protein